MVANAPYCGKGASCNRHTRTIKCYRYSMTHPNARGSFTQTKKTFYYVSHLFHFLVLFLNIWNKTNCSKKWWFLFVCCSGSHDTFYSTGLQTIRPTLHSRINSFTHTLWLSMLEEGLHWGQLYLLQTPARARQITDLRNLGSWHLGGFKSIVLPLKC